MSLDNPIRYPDVASTAVMTKRAWWLVLLGVLIPGAPQVLAGNRKLGRFGLISTFVLWIAVIGLGITYLVSAQAVFSLFTRSWTLTVVQIFLIFYSVLWVVLTLNTLTLVKFIKVRSKARGFVAAVAVLAMCLTAGTSAYAAYIVNSGRNLVSDVFAKGEHADPIDGYYNILLIGADAGDDRDGIRPDSMTVVSVNAETGAATMIGVPRDLCGFELPESSPLADIYNNNYDGLFDCKANGVYNVVESYYADVYPDAEEKGSEPGIEATKDAIEGITGIPIQYYVMVDMAGFASMIDALGGVTITVTDRIPLVAQGFEGEVPDWIEPGVQKMDGQLALWYARSRYETSDWDRMVRQRELQVAIIEQFTPANVLSKFQNISSASSQILRTDIPESMLAYFVDLAMKTKDLPIERIDLVPPLVDPDYPDIQFIHDHLREVLHPTPETTEPVDQ
ncbi:LCP family protein [Lysinibacter cavernae]|uniref:LCP family protein required for cell wall assembly n=1 Tax=Lysinibacter cavernae TaxID=1640652 RepID=A0A7X5R3R0_9MICO|nr:LCP family protein [Lysinibacter cavernae]NIH55113.1 LCP family protein required for cell wall assembly [Lysinibacter cavernae]